MTEQDRREAVVVVAGVERDAGVAVGNAKACGETSKQVCVIRWQDRHGSW